MTLILGFAPFILFSILSRLSADLALWISFSAAFVVTIRDFVERPVLRLLDAASLVLFGVMAVGRGFLLPDLSLAAVRALLDCGFMLAIGFSILRRQPFSAQYASSETRGHVWPPDQFLRVNYLISTAWLIAFAVMTLTEAVVTLLQVPLYVGIAVNIIVLGLAMTFSLRYPAYAASHLPRSAGKG